jgi:ClpP class serine protease
VIAYGDDFGQPQYYLAAQADEVFLHPEGMVPIEGSAAPNYYKEGLDKFGIEVHVFRVGEYKSAVEPYLRDDMSKEAKEMSLDTYGDLWRDWLADVGEARKIAPADIAAGIEALPDRLRAAHGDMALLAKEAKLVDTLAPRDEVRKRLIALTGEDKEKHSFKQIGYGDYLKSKGGDRTGATAAQGRGRSGRPGHDPRRHAARGDDRRRLDRAALAAGAGERRREGGGAARRQPGRQRLRDHPPGVRLVRKAASPSSR